MSTEDQPTRSPWVTLWFSPRQTIEHLVATRPTHLVLLLAILGTIAAFGQQIAASGGLDLFANWRFVLGLVLLCAVAGIVRLYVSAAILNWVARGLGGQATTAHVRTVFAWSTPPSILGAIIVAVIVSMTGGSTVVSDLVNTLLILIFALWSFVVFLLMLGRVEHFGFARSLLTALLNIVLAFVFAIFVRSFLYQPFNIPSGAMRPTLVVGDYFFASKFAYGYSRFSFPFSPPLWSGRILASDPALGDVVVFRNPNDTATDYIKRVAGLPGDRVQMRDGALYINGAEVKRERLADVAADEACGTEKGNIKRWRETLPNGVTYETLDCVDNGPLDNTNAVTVPAGHFFALGDNRDNSSDSRMWQLGFVPFDNLVGRASLIFYSRKARQAGMPGRARAERVGMVVR